MILRRRGEQELAVPGHPLPALDTLRQLLQQQQACPNMLALETLMGHQMHYVI